MPPLNYGQLGNFGAQAALVSTLLLILFRLRTRFGLSLLFITLGAAPSFQSLVVGVAHVASDPIKPLPDVGGVHRASRYINAPAGVVFSRQISAHSVEPTIASRSRNLFSHDDRGPDGGDEAMEVRPQMPWIVCTGSVACD